MDSAEIAVAGRPDGCFDVAVHQGSTRTEHVVSVPEGLAGDLGATETSDEQLVRLSFEFLLEREPPTSILRRFGLEVIEGYFPEYRRQMTHRLAGGAGPMT